MSKTTIQTYTGLALDITAPKPEMVNIVDIAHALSLICRFNGASRFHYSVGQHSVVVASLLGERKPELALEGLLHDAAEAYLGDVSSPLKAAIRTHSSVYKVLTEQVERVIAERFGLQYPWPVEVHEIDMMTLAIERRDVMHPSSDVTWQSLTDAPSNIVIPKNKPRLVEEAFLSMFQKLSSERAKKKAASQNVASEIIIPKGTPIEELKKFFPALN